MTLKMTEKERVEAAIQRCEQKLAAAGDELSRFYYRRSIVRLCSLISL